MAAFSERNGKWQAKVVRKGYPVQYQSFPTKAAAQVWARAVETSIDNGTWVDPASSDITLGELLAKYKAKITPTKRCRRSEEYRIGKMQRHKLANYSMRNLSTSVLADYRDERMKLVKPSSVGRELATICGVISHAQQEWGLKAINAAKLIKKPTLPPGRNRILKPEELDLLFGALHPSGHVWRNVWLVPLVRVALETAMRRGELLSLLWVNVDLQDRTAFLPLTKNGKARIVPLSTKAVEILSSLDRIDERVFPITDFTVDCAFKRAVKRAGITDFTFHDLRHMATTRLSKLLPNVIELSAVTGHSNVQNLKRYYHITAQELAAKIG